MALCIHLNREYVARMGIRPESAILQALQLVLETEALKIGLDSLEVQSLEFKDGEVKISMTGSRNHETDAPFLLGRRFEEKGFTRGISILHTQKDSVGEIPLIPNRPEWG